MHLIRGFTRLFERIHLRQRRMDLRFAHEPVRFPGLSIVGEVTALQRLQVHPEVPVVVLDLESGSRRARDDHAAALGNEHRRTHRLPARMLEDDVDVPADEAADLLAQSQPLARILLGLRRPELVVLSTPIDRVLASHLVEQFGPLLRRHDSDRCAAAIQHILHRVGADASGGTPHQHRLALCHLGAVRADDHAIAGAVAQRVARGLFPREVRGLRHQLIRLDDRDLGQAPEVRFEAPDALVRRHHRVVVRGRILIVDVQAVHRHGVAGPPVAHRGTRPQDNSGGVRAHHVEGLIVPFAPHAFLAEALQEAERRQWFEDRRPHRIEVDGGRHHRDIRLVGSELGQWERLDVR